MSAAPEPKADQAETDDIGVGPQRKDLLVILACFVVDVFFSGYYDGEPALTRFGFDLPLVLVLVLLLPAYAALAWRRRAPWPVFLFIVSFCLVMGLSLELFEPFAVTGLALYAVARRTPARRANPALVLMAFPSMSNAVTATNLTGDSSIFTLIVIGTIFMGFATLLWVLGRRERRSVLRARAEQEALRATAEESLGHERQRIARDLHDILSHSMSAMILQSAGAKAVSSKLDESPAGKQVTEALSAIETTGAESMRELHRLLGLLRTQDGDEGPIVPRLRLSDITPLIDATRHGGLVVQRHQEGEARPLDASVDLAAYHLVQESLTNAMKHAGRGAVVDIYETWEPEELQLQVRSTQGLASEESGSVSDGPDLAVRPAGSGTGLWGLNERVELAGGHFSSGRVDGGFVTVATFPLRALPTTTSQEGTP